MRQHLTAGVPNAVERPEAVDGNALTSDRYPLEIEGFREIEDPSPLARLARSPILNSAAAGCLRASDTLPLIAELKRALPGDD